MQNTLRDNASDTNRPIEVSIVVPALNEAEALPDLLRSIAAQRTEVSFETILSDGGSRDGTVRTWETLVDAWPSRGISTVVVHSGRVGRAAQMNAGAGAARGRILLFLHADTCLEAGALTMIVDRLSEPGTIGGGFRHRFRERGALLRVISAYANLRSLLSGIHYGDQAIFLNRVTFDALGGFQEVPLFEDLRLSRAMRKEGRVTTLPLPVTTSARRLLQGGVLRTSVRFGWLKFRHALGADPSRLKDGYEDVR